MIGIGANAQERLYDIKSGIVTMEMDMMGQVVKQTVWVYKGITLKSSINTDFGEMVQLATAIVEDVEIPAETFEIPEGLEIKSMSRRPMGGGPMEGGPGF